MTDSSSETGPRQRSVEIGVAVATALFGILVIVGALKAGAAWGSDGPGAGFFPFYIGLCIVLASAINFVRIFATVNRGRMFAEWGQLSSVAAVLVPTAIYAVAVPWLGIYVASMLLIAAFMKAIGRFGWGITVAISLAMPVFTFVIFEKWFLIPLPKGPIEAMLNL